MTPANSSRTAETGTILVVDDAPASLQLVASRLESAGYAVELAGEGEDALERARAIQPDLILLDIMLPGIDGIEVCRRLKRDVSTASIPVIFITSLDRPETTISGFAAGGVDFLTKPVHPEELLARVRTHVALRRLQEDLEARVRERTDALACANQQLRDEAAGREQTEATLRASEERYRELYEHNPAMYFTVSCAGRVLSVNRFGAEQLGYAVEELIGRPVVELFHPEDRGGAARQIGICTAEPGRLFSWELRKIRRDGSTLWVKELARAVVRPEGPVVFVVCEDITARRLLEAQLRQAQRMEAFGQLAGGVAHDFNNVLSVILGQAELALDPSTATGARMDALREIREASLRARNLTRQLLVFSRRQDMQFAPVDLNAMVADVAGLLGRVIGEHIALDLRLCPEGAPVRGDAAMLGQVVLNMAVNARDAMPAGGRLTISTARTTLVGDPSGRPTRGPPGEYVVLAVADNGCGIPPEIIGRIFEPFFTTKDVGQGTGLGLATSLSIVQQHQGWIEVESAPGEGARFLVHLPFRPEPATRPVASASALAPAEPGSQGTVLLVEDETSVRRVAMRTLERLGFSVVEASDGEEALEAWAEHRGRIDLVLTDIVMPGRISGRALARKLREEAPGQRVALMTGYDPEVLAQKLNDEDRKLPHIQKPFTIDALAEFIRKTLAG